MGAALLINTRAGRKALKSPLFCALNSEGLLLDDHIGGCTLYMNRERVEQIMAEQRAHAV